MLKMVEGIEASTTGSTCLVKLDCTHLHMLSAFFKVSGKLLLRIFQLYFHNMGSGSSEMISVLVPVSAGCSLVLVFVRRYYVLHAFQLQKCLMQFVLRHFNILLRHIRHVLAFYEMSSTSSLSSVELLHQLRRKTAHDPVQSENKSTRIRSSYSRRVENFY